jgi:hypothetical protein
MPDPILVQDIVLVVLLWLLVDRLPRWWMRHDDLGLTIFTPWRGDPWPRGVQEDDDFRFDWRPSPTPAGPSLDLVVDVDEGGLPMPAIEDRPASGERVTLEPAGPIDVHRAGH